MGQSTEYVHGSEENGHIIIYFLWGMPREKRCLGRLGRIGAKVPQQPVAHQPYFFCFLFASSGVHLSTTYHPSLFYLIYFCGLARSVLLFLSFHLFILFLFKICMGKLYVSVCMYGVPSSLSHTQTHTHDIIMLV